ncbi:hypothetical protein CEXT_428421 [Caerostris extrusa]|uniref:Uncharacterized protein n=1 Tax=Caerostris extrusa TaxID=172846 RepID=A0AAV4QUS4_CAEEX|nr:hypothetical protein CEXT_428421 [Caerostris extrusa]
MDIDQRNSTRGTLSKKGACHQWIVPLLRTLTERRNIRSNDIIPTHRQTVRGPFRAPAADRAFPPFPENVWMPSSLR